VRSENGKIPGGGSKTLPCEDMHGLQCKKCAQSDTMQEMRVEGFENEIQSPREVNRFGVEKVSAVSCEFNWRFRMSAGV